MLKPHVLLSYYFHMNLYFWEFNLECVLIMSDHCSGKHGYKGQLAGPASIPMPQSESESGSVVLTLCDPMDYTVHGILQARILEYVAFPFFRGSS